MNNGRIKNLSGKDYKYIFTRVPRLCVDVVIANRDGVLLSRRNIPPYAGRWYLPGGRVLKDESLVGAAKRICRDELGVRAEVIKILGAIEFFTEPRARHFITHSVSIVFLVQSAGRIIRKSKQASANSFFKLLPKNIPPEVKRFLLTHRHIWQ